jgi:heme A synthase
VTDGRGGLEIARLRRSHRLVAGGGIALLVVMFFFKWFGASVSADLPGGTSFSFGSSVDAWHSLSDTRWLLLATVIAALLFAIVVASGREPEPAGAALLMGIASITAACVLYRILDHPHGGASLAGGSFSYGAKLGLYLGFLACAAIAYGAWGAFTEAGSTLAGAGHAP